MWMLGPNPGVGVWLDRTLMSRGVRKKLEITQNIILTNLHLAKESVKSTSELVPPEVLPLGVPGHKVVISGSYSLISEKVSIPR